MDIRNEKNNIFNTRLAKLIGLYQILDPGTVKFRGKNVYHIVMAFVFLYICVDSMIFNICGLYYCPFNMPLSIDYFWKAEGSLYIVYVMWIVVRHSNDVWNCLSITRYDFTSFNFRKRYINTMDRCREHVLRLTNAYGSIYLVSTVFYVGSTLAFSEKILPVKNYDGSVGYYRQNVMNFYLIVSDETYNAHYNIFYFAETLYFVLVVLLYLIFDTLLVTLCYALCCQMQMICFAFESLGHQSLYDPHSPIEYTDGKKMVSNEHDLIYDELKTIVMDHQEVIKKFEDFLTLFGRTVLLRIFILSFTQIVLWFILIMGFSDVDRFKASEVIVKKVMYTIPGLLFQLFMVCYLIGRLHNQKDSIIFALYSSNWTKMNMKCKKLILLTMKMNNANQKKLNFTRTKIVNLEMFFKTVGNCYSVISVLVNYTKTNSK